MGPCAAALQQFTAERGASAAPKRLISPHLARALHLASASASNAVPPAEKVCSAPTSRATSSHMIASRESDLAATQTPWPHFHTVLRVTMLSLDGALTGVA